MKQVVYAMRFTGQGVPDSSATNVVCVSGRAASCRISSIVGPDGLRGQVESLDGGVAQFETEVRSAGDTAFDESGSITFGEGADRVHFSTIGQGFMAPVADGLQHGCVSWRVDGGEGRLVGASGSITSNFTLGARGEVSDYQVGLLSLP
jgi:hypothetical protein